MKKKYLIILLIGCSGCTKFIDPGPPKISITSATVYNTTSTAAAVLTSVYSSLPSDMSSFLTRVPALSADELNLFGGAQYSGPKDAVPIYLNRLTPSTIKDANFVPQLYIYIYTANAALEGLAASTGLSDATRNQLLGESRFIRAFCYFYLVNYFGKVPLVTTTDYKLNTSMPNSPTDKIYELIISDLQAAQSLLTNTYVDKDATTAYPAGAEERVRPNKWAAIALLARVYLYTEKWKDAEDQATTIINNTALYQITSLDSTFLKNNREGIWQLQPTWNTVDQAQFILYPWGPDNDNPFYLSDQLEQSFEPNDQRKVKWVNYVDAGGTRYYFSFKYTDINFVPAKKQYVVALRLGEQYLIRAEARAQQDNLSGAAADLNVIRARAGLDPVTAANKNDMLNAIYHERQVELFMEYGHRWLDLKRTHRVDEVMNIVCPKKGGTWNSYQQLYPFSSDEMTNNPNLVQNPGYH